MRYRRPVGDVINGTDGSDVFFGRDAGLPEWREGMAVGVDGGAGSDTISFDVPSWNYDRTFVNLGDGELSLFEYVSPNRVRSDVIHSNSIENVIGSSRNDYLIGDGQRNLLDGRFGNDILDGRGGNDLLIGHGGDDRLFDGAGSDALFGGSGRNTFGLVADGSTDAIYDFNPRYDVIDLSQAGVYGAHQLTVSEEIREHKGRELVRLRIEYNDEVLLVRDRAWSIHAEDVLPTITYSKAWITVTGSQMADVIVDGTGRDKMAGGDGADTFKLSRDGILDYVTDFTDGVDRIDLSGWDVSFDDLAIQFNGRNKFLVRHEDERLTVRMMSDDPVEAAMLDADDFILA